MDSFCVTIGAVMLTENKMTVSTYCLSSQTTIVSRISGSSTCKMSSFMSPCDTASLTFPCQRSQLPSNMKLRSGRICESCKAGGVDRHRHGNLELGGVPMPGVTSENKKFRILFVETSSEATYYVVAVRKVPKHAIGTFAEFRICISNI